MDVAETVVIVCGFRYLCEMRKGTGPTQFNLRRLPHIEYRS
jgi:hypothetical protein